MKMNELSYKYSNYSKRYLLYFTFKTLSNRRKLELLALFIIAPITSVAESFSLLAIGPFLNGLTTDNLSQPESLNAITQPIANILGLNSLTTVTIIFTFFAILSNLLRLLQLYANNFFSASLESELSTKTFLKTISQNYERHINQSSSQHLNLLTNHISNYGGFVKNFLQLVTSSILAISILFTLLYIDSLIFFVSFVVIFIFYYLISINTKDKVRSLMAREMQLRKHQIRITQESLSSIKDIILDSAHLKYKDNYETNDFPMRRISASATYLTASPKYLMEAVGLTLIAFIALILRSSETSNTSSIAALGTLGLAAQRFLPLLQIIFSSWIGFNASTVSASDIVDVLSQPKVKYHSDPIPLKLHELIEFKNVSYRYPGTEKDVIKSLNLSIPLGQRVALVGITGSGKTTTIDLLMGLLLPSKGKILIDGSHLKDEAILRSWRANIGHVPQTTFLTEDSIMENIALGKNIDEIDFDRIKKVSEIAMLSDFVDTLPEKYNTKVGERGVKLSGGQRQRIALARALYKQATVLILDEATSALDNATERRVINSLARLNKNMTIIMIAHRLATIDLCERVIKFDGGKMISDGCPNEIL
ncbi:Phospholipid-lipopolysaccharide ABC transporter [Prochlorococcus marinus str. SS35]|uniref:ABC-type multidrug transport system ATPase and permease components n=2 Tax=Prochlorococcaceae TaxID=2881426 RepID=Q7VAX1_PROMA|nr:ABC-type multidrug transport system ATPase and permease components [Prochlorococcus marinus subsp. marinus str. CCMP1375]KGG24511.1 Phospholipid-lipopolysaccharide ABC transporter [Prochlorococcus marinus str. SS35]